MLTNKYSCGFFNFVYLSRTVFVSCQLVYKNYRGPMQFHVIMPKMEAGIPRDVKIAGLSNFVFMSRNGRLMILTTVNFILRDIVKAYNEEENDQAKRERKKLEEMLHISARILRHTVWIRMEETDPDMKVVQYVMKNFVSYWRFLRV